MMTRARWICLAVVCPLSAILGGTANHFIPGWNMGWSFVLGFVVGIIGVQICKAFER